MAAFTFEHVDVKEEMVQVLKKQLPGFGFPSVKVLKSDPQTQAEVPCIGINRVDDSETEQSLADAAGVHYDQATQTYYQVFGTYFSESVEVRIWHTNADERDKLYRHVKAMLVALRQPLVEKGLLNITLRSGRDEQDSSMAQAPMVLYWSAITMSYLNPMDVTFTEVVPAITAINAPMSMDTDTGPTKTVAPGTSGAGTTRVNP